MVDEPVYNARMGGPKSLRANLQSRPARERIVVTAHDLFYRDGIRATGIDSVIEHAKVTKVTFYRHFKSKNALIVAYLEYRHERWMKWFIGALERHGGTLRALVPAMAEWFRSPEYRGCAFINGVSEIAPMLPEVIDITRRHKADMQKAIAALLPPGVRGAPIARSLALVVDGAIVQAQFCSNLDVVLRDLRELVTMIANENEPQSRAHQTAELARDSAVERDAGSAVDHSRKHRPTARRQAGVESTTRADEPR